MAIIQRPEAVSTIQEILNKAGYNTGGVDGMWGRNTSAGFNHFVRDVQAHLFPDDAGEQDGLYGNNTHAALREHIQTMYADTLSAEDMERLVGALDQMVERVDPNGAPSELGRPLINRLHAPSDLPEFESRITPRPVEAAAETVVETDVESAAEVEAEFEAEVEAAAPEIVEPEVVEPVAVIPTEPEEIIINGQPTLALPEQEAAAPVPVLGQVITPAYAADLSDAAIADDATNLLRRATESLRYGTTMGLGGHDNGQTQALGDISFAAGDPLYTAQVGTDVMERVVGNLDLQQRNLVAGNAPLAEYVRSVYPDVADTPEAVVEKLREPGVAHGLLAGDTPDGNPLGERAALREFIDMESERLGAVRLQEVMVAERARLESEAAPAAATEAEADVEAAPAPAVESVPVVEPVPMPLIYAGDWSDDDIADNAIMLTERAVEAMVSPTGAIDGEGVRAQVAAWNALDAVRDGSPEDIARVSGEVLAEVDARLEARQLAVVGGSPRLMDYVRGEFPGTGEGPQAVLETLRGPGVMHDILNNRMVGMGALGTAPEREAVQSIYGMEAERHAAANIARVVGPRADIAAAPAQDGVQARIDQAFEAAASGAPQPELEEALQSYVQRQAVPGLGQ